MRSISFWLAGMGFVQAGHASVRALEALLPANPVDKGPPLWTVALQAASCGLHLLAARGVRERTRWGRPLAAALVTVWLCATFVALNTGTVPLPKKTPHPVEGPRPSVLEPRDDPAQQSHFMTSLGQSWMAVGWPSMPGNLDEWIFQPTPLWTAPDYAFAGVWLALGTCVLATLLASRQASPLPPLDPSDRRANARRVLAAFRDDANPSRWQRGLGWALAGHLALMGVLTMAALVGLSFKVMGRHH